MKNFNFMFLLIVIFIVACEKDPISSEGGMASLTLNAQYVTSVPGKIPTGSYINSRAIDAITITRARFMIRNVNFRSVPEDSMEFVSDPYIIDLNLDGQPHTIAVKNVPAKTYDRIDFRVHRLDDDDPRDLAYFQHPDFQDFVADNRYSMIIEGTVQEGNNLSETFVFKSRDNENQRHFFNPHLVVDESTNQITVVFEFNGTNWFMGEDGALLDPGDESNENEISENLKDSIEIVDKRVKNDSSSDDNFENGDDSY